MPGRHPKPAAVKAMTGNPGRRPIAASARPPLARASMPDFVARDEDAKWLWERYAPTLEILDTLTEGSERLFGTWCVEQAMYERAPGEYQVSRLAQLRMLASSLGMDPSSLGKFAFASPDSADPTDEFFTGPQLAS